VSAERIAPASVAFLGGLVLLRLAWKRDKSPASDDTLPSSVTVHQGPGSGGAAFGPNARGGDGGDVVSGLVYLEAGKSYPVDVGQGATDGGDGKGTSFAGIHANGGKGAGPSGPGVVAFPGASGLVQIIGPLSLDADGNPTNPDTETRPPEGESG
jgi:hypothetical protein